MRIRIHVKNSMEVSDDSRCHEEYTQVILISFWLWLKSLFCGLDLTINAWSFPQNNNSAADEDRSPSQESTSLCSNEESRDVPIEKPVQKSKKVWKRGKKIQRPMSDEELFGIQWDDYTVVYPAARNGNCADIKSLRTKSTYTPTVAVKEIISEVSEMREDHDVKPANEIEIHPHEPPVQTSHSEYPIDFKNPPHSTRWKARNLPPRKPYIPAE